MFAVGLIIYYNDYCINYLFYEIAKLISCHTNFVSQALM